MAAAAASPLCAETAGANVAAKAKSARSANSAPRSVMRFGAALVLRREAARRFDAASAAREAYAMVVEGKVVVCACRVCPLLVVRRSRGSCVVSWLLP